MRHWKYHLRKKMRWLRVTCLCSFVTLGYIYFVYISNETSNNHRLDKGDHLSKTLQIEDIDNSWRTRHMLQVDENATTNDDMANTGKSTAAQNGSKNGIYPPDVFTDEQKKNGAIVLHVLGMIYMFVALAIVCDEFFVPALGVIIDRLKITDDVAGATFMAAGGSAPELFTSIFGVFLAQNNVGTGTIVGSAVFNILFVIGMCAISSRTVLQLTWWPLFRDVFFYSVSLALLIVFFRGGEIIWYEALVLFCVYFLYVLFMKFNHQVEGFVKMQLHRTFKSVSPSDQGKRPPSRRKQSLPHFRDTHHFRHGALQLMLHTLDPLSEAQNLDEKAVHLQSMARNSQPNGNGVHHPVENGHLNNCNSFPPPPPPLSPIRSELHNNHNSDSTVNSRENIMRAEVPPSENPELGEIRTISHPNVANEDGVTDPHRDTVTTQSTTLDSSSPDLNQGDGIELIELPAVEEIDEPLDLSWPSTLKQQITYIVVAPLIFPLWIMLPDVRRPEKEKWYPWTFLGSIFWIGGFSYLMLWWANEVGETIGISDAVMGLTFLAAGTSIPDLITSVIVARKGLGDMAVSSSIGSNIFDVTVGLPLPWLLYAIIYAGAPVSVESRGLFCAIILLFGMLIFVIFIIALCKWRMTKFLGAMMFVLYFIFLTFALLLELGTLVCPFDG